MTVRVVARQITVVQPQHPFGMERLFQILLDLLAALWLIAVRSQQTGRSGQDGTLAVAFDGAPFEHEAQMVPVVAPHHLRGKEAAIDLVVVVGGKLHAPAVETEVQQFGTLFAHTGDEAMVARPRVVGGAFHPQDILQHVCRQLLREQFLYRLLFRSDDEQLFAAGNLISHAHIALRHLRQQVAPVGVLMRPSELHTALRIPFRRQKRPLGLR